MMVPFVKMHAQGNDFVILDGLHDALPEVDEALVRAMAERRFGVGCDQLLLLLPDEECDSRLRIFNADGTEAMNCGNGLRCVADLLMRRLNSNAPLLIALPDRQVRAECGENFVKVEVGRAVITDEQPNHSDVDVGNLHRVVFQLQGEDSFPAERNIEIVSGQIADHVYIDIIERGAGPTKACGSGACATATAIWHREKHQRPMVIEMPGGSVRVSCDHGSVWLEGEVVEVFSGRYAHCYSMHVP